MTANQRFLALDVFRGMTICFMIIVNTPGNHATTYAPLLHAQWHGFTPTDLVFPSFLFAVGNAMSFVMPKWAGKNQSEVWAKVVKRTLLIFLLGYLMYWFPFFRIDATHHISLSPIAETRIMGVLQRIALCYGIASLMLYYLKPRVAVAVSVGLLLLYWGLCYWFGDAADPLSLQGNAGIKLDKWLLGGSHLYHKGAMASEPEGLLSTLPAIVNVVAGYVAGQFIQQKGKTYEGISRLLLAGFVLFVVSYCWDFSFPINKKLWTSSFVLHTVGLDCMILAAIIYVIDFKHRTRWTWFFEIFGRNPLFIYLLSEILVTILYMIKVEPGVNLFHWLYLHIFSYSGAYLGSLLLALAYMLLCLLAGYWLDKKKIYIRV